MKIPGPPQKDALGAGKLIDFGRHEKPPRDCSREG